MQFFSPLQLTESMATYLDWHQYFQVKKKKENREEKERE